MANIKTKAITSNSRFLSLEQIDDFQVENAYEHCRQITREGSKTFYFGSLFLPPEKRQAMWAIYTFCRFTDDLVDCADTLPPEIVRHNLDVWEVSLRQSLNGLAQPARPDTIAWVDTVLKFQLSLRPPLELLEGVRMDLDKRRYANFDELKLYCYRVASTVGLMASDVIGFEDSRALEYAINLGIAMQLTNILRDVGEDAAKGRIYIPQDELQEYGYSEEELLRGEINPRFVQLMQFQIARARHYYEQAIPGIEYLDKKCRFSISLAASLYSQILGRIEHNKYDVFTKRAYVPTRQKVGGLASAWLRSRFGKTPILPNPLRLDSDCHEADA